MNIFSKLSATLVLTLFSLAAPVRAAWECEVPANMNNTDYWEEEWEVNATYWVPYFYQSEWGWMVGWHFAQSTWSGTIAFGTKHMVVPNTINGVSYGVEVTYADSTTGGFSFTGNGGDYSFDQDFMHFEGNEPVTIRAWRKYPFDVAVTGGTTTVGGYTFIRTGVGAFKDITLTISNTATPSDVTFASSDTGVFTVSEQSRAGGTVVLRLTGVAASTVYPGEDFIKVVYQSNPTCSMYYPTVRVSYPRIQNHLGFSALSVENEVTGSSGAGGTMSSHARKIATIKIWDQAYDSIDDLYNGEQVYEQFSASGGGLFVTTKQAITTPPGGGGIISSGGYVTDRSGVGFSIGFSPGQFTSTQLSNFLSKTLAIPDLAAPGTPGTYDNLLDAYNVAVSGSADQSLWVGSFDMANTATRSVTFTSRSISFNVTDTDN